MAERWHHHEEGLTSPGRRLEIADVTSGDDHVFDNPTRMIMWATDGEATFKVLDNDGETTLTLKQGMCLPVRVEYIEATTAATIVGIW